MVSSYCLPTYYRLRSPLQYILPIICSIPLSISYFISFQSRVFQSLAFLFFVHTFTVFSQSSFQSTFYLSLLPFPVMPSIFHSSSQIAGVWVTLRSRWVFIRIGLLLLLVTFIVWYYRFIGDRISERLHRITSKWINKKLS